MSDQAGPEVKPHYRGCIKRWNSLHAVLSADLHRYAGNSSVKSAIKHYLFTPGFKCTVLVRICGYLRAKPFYAAGLYPIMKLILLRSRYKYGIVIPDYTLIAPGLFINRFGGVYIGGDAVIHENVNITHGVLLGYVNRGPRIGCPEIGPRSFLGSGAKVIGGIKLGAECSVGANAVVTKDVPDLGVVGGVPAKLISLGGSEGYINRQVPAELMRRCRDAFVGPVPDGFMHDAG